MKLIFSFVLICLMIGSVLPLSNPQSRLPLKDDAWVEQTLKSMTLDEKVGQMLVPSANGTFRNVDSEAFQKIKKDIEVYHVGGYHAFGGDPTAAALMLNRMQSWAKIPLLITADFEGGVGIQYPGATILPRAMAIGATGSEDFAYQCGRVTAMEQRAIGVHVNFYPVVDVNNNPNNPIINIRSFGEDPKSVSRLAIAYIKGEQENGGIATAKHFPGHGDTSTDSHMELPTIDVDRARLDQIEFPSFRAAIDEGVGAVMSAHIYLPKLESEKGLPSTLSPKILTGILRDEMKFKGIIFTDAMTMQGVAAHYTPEDATLRAVKAGADVILHPVSTEKSFNAIKQAVQSGQIPESRIDDSVRRLLSAKAALGLNKNRMVDVQKLDEVLGTRESHDVTKRIMENAVTLVRDEKEILPLKLDENKQVLVINLVDATDGWRSGIPGRTFAQDFIKRHAKTIDVQITDRTSPAEYELIKKIANAADAVVVSGFIRVGAQKGTVALNDAQMGLLKTVSKMNKPFVFSLFGSPFLIEAIPEIPSYILAYEYLPEAESATVRAIFGEIEFKGKLPVSLPGLYPIGHGIHRSVTAGK